MSIATQEQFPTAPLLTPRTMAGLRAMAAGERWPKKSLTNLQLDWCEAERAVHIAQVANDPAAGAAARLKRAEAYAALLDEQRHVADVFLTTLSHAATHKPAEVADLFAQLFCDSRIRAAFVPVLQQLLQPTVDMLRGEQQDIADRVTELETATAGEAVYA